MIAFFSKKNLLAALFLGILLRGAAQDSVHTRIEILFWEGLNWQQDYSSVYDFIYTEASPTPLAARQFTRSGRLQSEYLRMDDSTWSFSAYDTANAYPAEPLVRGQYRQATRPADWRIDTLLQFDPNTYDPMYTVTIRKNLWRHGEWMEQEPAAQAYGRYRDGLREGLWVELCQGGDGFDEFAFLYQKGIPVRDTVLNLAQSDNAERLLEALCSGPWTEDRRETRGTRRLEYYTKRPGNSIGPGWEFRFHPDHWFELDHFWSCGVRDHDEGRWEYTDAGSLLLYGLGAKAVLVRIEYLKEDFLILSH